MGVKIPKRILLYTIILAAIAVFMILFIDTILIVIGAIVTLIAIILILMKLGEGKTSGFLYFIGFAAMVVGFLDRSVLIVWLGLIFLIIIYEIKKSITKKIIDKKRKKNN